MRNPIKNLLAGAGLLTVTVAQAASPVDYQITITNLTVGESFTPIMAASHSALDNAFFTLGQPASDELADMAEGGDTAPLQGLLEASAHHVTAVVNAEGLTDPGQSVTLTLSALPGRDVISLAGMLIPTNDGFMALQNLPLPRGAEVVSRYAVVYDAGSEPNDELCISIPGPVCGGEGGSPGVSGEGYVHIHSGIHGIGDLSPAGFDWRNPAALIEITRVP